MIWLLLFATLFVVGAVAFYKVPWFNKFCKDSETVAIWLFGIFASGLAEVLKIFNQDQLQAALQTIVVNAGAAQWWPVYLAFFSALMVAVWKFRQPGA